MRTSRSLPIAGTLNDAVKLVVDVLLNKKTRYSVHKRVFSSNHEPTLVDYLKRSCVI